MVNQPVLNQPIRYQVIKKQSDKGLNSTWNLHHLEPTNKPTNIFSLLCLDDLWAEAICYKPKEV